MTCKHCDKDDIDMMIDTTGAAQPPFFNFDFNSNNAACATPTFCSCECHNIYADAGAK